MLNLSAEIIDVLTCKEKTLIITVGNSLRADDGAGPYIGSKLTPQKSFDLINAESRPEDALDQAKDLNPKRIIIIDAADFEGNPGEIKIIPDEAIPEKTLSTHSIPLNLVARLLKQDTQAEIIFLGIQPQEVGYKEELSEPVKQACEMIIETLQKSIKP
jgi:hydrogenase 3 maturation protease